MPNDSEALYVLHNEPKIDAVYLGSDVSVPEVNVVPEQPYPSQEVFVTISFYTSWSAGVEHSLTQNGNVFNIYVTVTIGILPRATPHFLNVSLGKPAIGSYEVNIGGLYYPRILRFVVDYVHSIKHVAEVYGYPFVMTTESNSTVSAFAVNADRKQIDFDVNGEDGTEGYCNITIPRLLLDGEFSLFIDDMLNEYSLVQNSSHSSLHFTYPHSTHTVSINGTIFAEPPLPKIFRVPDINPTLQEAIDTANSGDTIRVRAGTYYENLLIDKSVSIVGEGQTTTITDDNSGYWQRVVAVVAPNVSISEFSIQIDHWEGVVVGGPYCMITHNKIIGYNLTRYGYGIVLYADYNTITDNNITRTISGIIVESYYNTICHNDFIDNERHAEVWGPYASFWNDSYPSGGNYWSAYAAADAHSGFFQNETGSDGIADSPYIIDGNNRDNYPLMAPISTFDAGTWNNAPCEVSIISNSTVSSFTLNETQKAITVNVTGESGLGFCRVTIPNVIIQNMWQDNYAVLVDNQPPLEMRNWTDAENTYLHFTYQHSQHQITIIPENLSITLLIAALTLTATTTTLLEHKKKNPSRLKWNA
jgi:hypothetical protein